MNEFLEFKEVIVKGIKTKRFDVFSTHDHSYLGWVYWRSGWRRYVMHHLRDTDWSCECERQCYVFLNQLMQERKVKS